MGIEGVLVEEGGEVVGFASIVGLLGYSLVWKADSFKDLGSDILGLPCCCEIGGRFLGFYKC